MPEGARQSGQTQAHEYYILCRDRVLQEEIALQRGFKRLFTIEAISLACASAFTVAAWIALARQAEVVTYNRSGLMLMANGLACVIWLTIQGIFCYVAGWKLTRSAELTLKDALKAWHNLRQESERTKELCESICRLAEEPFPLPSLTSPTAADGSLTQMESQSLNLSFRLIQFLWLALFVSGLAFSCMQIWIVWTAINTPPGIGG